MNLKCQHLAQFALMPTHLELQCWKHWLKWCISENAHCLKFRQHQTNSCVLMIPFVLRAQHVKNHEPIWTQELENGASTERCFFFCEKLKILGVFFENNKHYQIIQRANSPPDTTRIFFSELCWLQCWNAPLFFAVREAAIYQLQDGENYA